ncbi:MAG TPA: CvpA family protein [Ignavibacteria bacterium]|jgi:membrane protein required for colicin V production
MNWLDIVIFFIVAVPAYFGFRKGFMRKLLGIIGIVAGFILAVRFYENAAKVLSAFIKESPLIVDVISFLFIVGVVYGISLWLARFMSDIGGGVNFLNKALGIIFGFFQGLIVASILLYNLAFINFPSPETRNSSILYHPVYKIAPAIFDKIIELFPGLKETYQQYKGKPPEEKK